MVLYITLAVLAVVIVYKAIKNNWSSIVKWSGITGLIVFGAYMYVNYGPQIAEFFGKTNEAAKSLCEDTQSTIVSKADSLRHSK